MTGRRQHIPGTPRAICFATVALCSLANTGCMHRRMMIDSDPPGAQVLIDGKEEGQTPLGVDHTYYATREITLIKDGYETQTVMQKVRTPWYQIFPLDFFTDNFLPFHATNRQRFLYQLQPKQHVPEQEFLDRGNATRSESHVGP